MNRLECNSINGVIMKFGSTKIMNKVKKRLYYEDNLLPLQIIQNEEKLLLSNIWFPAKIQNNNDYEEMQNFYKLKNYRNRYSSVCYCGGTYWKFGLDECISYSQLRCSNPDCTNPIFYLLNSNK